MIVLVPGGITDLCYVFVGPRWCYHWLIQFLRCYIPLTDDYYWPWLLFGLILMVLCDIDIVDPVRSSVNSYRWIQENFHVVTVLRYLPYDLELLFYGIWTWSFYLCHLNLIVVFHSLNIVCLGGIWLSGDGDGGGDCVDDTVTLLTIVGGTIYCIHIHLFHSVVMVLFWYTWALLLWFSILWRYSVEAVVCRWWPGMNDGQAILWLNGVTGDYHDDCGVLCWNFLIVGDVTVRPIDGIGEIVLTVFSVHCYLPIFIAICYDFGDALWWYLNYCWWTALPWCNYHYSPCCALPVMIPDLWWYSVVLMKFILRACWKADRSCLCDCNPVIPLFAFDPYYSCLLSGIPAVMLDTRLFISLYIAFVTCGTVLWLFVTVDCPWFYITDGPLRSLILRCGEATVGPFWCWNLLESPPTICRFDYGRYLILPSHCSLNMICYSIYSICCSCGVVLTTSSPLIYVVVLLFVDSIYCFNLLLVNTTGWLYCSVDPDSIISVIDSITLMFSCILTVVTFCCILPDCSTVCLLLCSTVDLLNGGVVLPGGYVTQGWCHYGSIDMPAGTFVVIWTTCCRDGWFTLILHTWWWRYGITTHYRRPTAGTRAWPFVALSPLAIPRYGDYWTAEPDVPHYACCCAWWFYDVFVIRLVIVLFDLLWCRCTSLIAFRYSTEIRSVPFYYGTYDYDTFYYTFGDVTTITSYTVCLRYRTTVIIPLPC